jgi:integrase
MSVERIKRKGGEVVWRVRWREAGRNRSRVLGAKRDALDFDAELRQRKRAGTLAQLDAGTETLDEYVTGTWWPGFAGHLAPKTRGLYCHLYDRHLSPCLGAFQLRELTPETIARWQSDKLNAGTGPVAVQKSLALLGNILGRALDAGRIPSNPARRVRKAKLPSRQEVRPLAPAHVEKMRAALDQRDATFISVLAYAGLRPQEARALRWGQVRDRTLVVNASKTGRRRTVRLLGPLATDLAAWRMACGRPADTVPVFPGQDGEPWSEAAFQSWRRRTFDRARAVAAAQDATPYTLRHSFCSLLLAEGRSVVYVARQLGHRASLTTDTYGHVIDELDGAERVNAEAAIRAAREAHVPVLYPPAAGSQI